MRTGFHPNRYEPGLRVRGGRNRTSREAVSWVVVQSRHRAVAGKRRRGGSTRGANDGLVSNLSLVAGVAGAGARKPHRLARDVPPRARCGTRSSSASRRRSRRAPRAQLPPRAPTGGDQGLCRENHGRSERGARGDDAAAPALSGPKKNQVRPAVAAAPAMLTRISATRDLLFDHPDRSPRARRRTAMTRIPRPAIHPRPRIRSPVA